MRTLFLIVFVDLIGFGIIIPLLPFLGEHYHASPVEVGLLLATFSLTQFVFAPIWGRLSDTIGRRPVLICSLAGAVLAYLGLAFADTLWMLYVARAFAGAMAGNISTAFAYVADVTTPAARARGMGIVGAAFGLGFIFGPAIGGVLAGADLEAINFGAPALAAAGLSAVALLLTIAFLKESLPAEIREQHQSVAPRGRWEAFFDALNRRSLARLIGIAFLATCVFAGMETTFAMWSRRAFGWGPLQNGYLFAFVGLISALIQGGLVGRLARRYGETRLVTLGAALLALGMLAIPLAGSLPPLVVAMTFVAAGFGLMTPSLNSLISLQVSAAFQGGTMGVARSATTLARVLGPAWAGMLFEYAGRDWPFFVGACVMLLVIALLLHGWTSLASTKLRGE